MKKLSWQEVQARDPDSCGESRWQEGQCCRVRALIRNWPEDNAAKETGEREGAPLEEMRLHPNLKTLKVREAQERSSQVTPKGPESSLLGQTAKVRRRSSEHARERQEQSASANRWTKEKTDTSRATAEKEPETQTALGWGAAGTKVDMSRARLRPCQKAVTASATCSSKIPLLAKTRVQLTGQGSGRRSRAGSRLSPLAPREFQTRCCCQEGLGPTDTWVTLLKHSGLPAEPLYLGKKVGSSVIFPGSWRNSYVKTRHLLAVSPLRRPKSWSWQFNTRNASWGRGRKMGKKRKKLKGQSSCYQRSLKTNGYEQRAAINIINLFMP